MFGVPAGMRAVRLEHVRPSPRIGLVFADRAALVDYMRANLGEGLVTLHQAHHPEIAVDGETATGATVEFSGEIDANSVTANKGSDAILQVGARMPASDAPNSDDPRM